MSVWSELFADIGRPAAQGYQAGTVKRVNDDVALENAVKQFQTLDPLQKASALRQYEAQQQIAAKYRAPQAPTVIPKGAQGVMTRDGKMTTFPAQTPDAIRDLEALSQHPILGPMLFPGLKAGGAATEPPSMIEGATSPSLLRQDVLQSAPEETGATESPLSQFIPSLKVGALTLRGKSPERQPMGESSAHYAAKVRWYMSPAGGGHTENAARDLAWEATTGVRSKRAGVEASERTIGGNTGPAQAAKVDTAGKTGEAAAAGGVRGKLLPTPSPLTGTAVPGQQAIAEAGTLGQGIEAGEKKTLADLYATKQLATRIIELSGNFTKPAYFGPVSGRMAFVQEHLGGVVPGVPALAEEEIMLRRAMADAKDALLRARSGAQINEAEYKRLANLLPGPELPMATAKARMTDFLVNLDNIIRQRESVQGVTQGEFRSGRTPRAPASTPSQATPRHRLSGTKTTKPDGTYSLKDGTTITVKGGVVQ